MNERIKTIGFDPKKEVDFLNRVNGSRRENLTVELETQLAEDFGLVKFVQRYDLVNGKIMDPISGKNLLEIISNGGTEEELKEVFNKKIAKWADKIDYIAVESYEALENLRKMC